MLFRSQLSFLIVLFAVGAAAVLLYRMKALKPENMALLVIVVGIALRLCYFLYTNNHIVRQHDLWGAWSHLDYMKHVARTCSLPGVGIYETYHPPLHYILSAIPFGTVMFFGGGEGLAITAVMLLMIFFSSLTLIFIFKIMKQIKLDGKILLVAVAFASFQPNLIYMSVYLNNDSTVFLLYTISIYYLLKWFESRKTSHVVLLAVFTALAMLAKKSAMVLYPVLGIVFIIELIRHRTEYRKYLFQGGIFLLIAVPLGFSYQIRNYILFQQDISYAVAPLGTVMPNNPYNLFFVPVKELLANPFVSDAPHENTFFLKMLIQTSLFSVFRFNELIDIAVVMMFCYLVLTGLLVLYFILSGKKEVEGSGYIFLLNFVSVLLFYFRMRLYSPYDCTQAFRYIAPFIMVSLAYYMGKSVIRFSGTRFPVLNSAIQGVFWLFCGATVLFIMMIGPPII